MNVNVRNGRRTVRLTVTERKLLANATNLLGELGLYSEECMKAAKLISVVSARVGAGFIVDQQHGLFDSKEGGE